MSLQGARALYHAPSTTKGRGAALCFAFGELLMTIVQWALVVGVASGVAAGWFGWSSLLLLIILLSFGNGALSAAALLIRGALPHAPTLAELTRLLLLAPAEYILYRPAVALARLRDARAIQYD